MKQEEFERFFTPDVVGEIKRRIGFWMKQRGAGWGPDWGSLIFQFAPEEEGGRNHLHFSYGVPKEWNAEWSANPYNFFMLAVNKAAVAYRTSLPTSVAAQYAPALLQKGDWLYPGGVPIFAEGPGGTRVLLFSVGFSGFQGWADERIAVDAGNLLRGLMMAAAAADRDNGAEQV